MKSKKTIIICALVTILILGGVISGVSLLFNHPLRIEKPTFIYIDRDDTADSVYVKLQRDLNATHLTGFKMLARLKKYDQQIHSGAYRFDASINTLTLFRRLSSGHQTPVKVVIPSVRTLSRLARSLDRQLMPDSTEFARLVGDSAFCASLGFSLETMPALFIPNTYEAYWNTDAEAFIQRMKKEYERFWTQERKDKAQACGLTPVEVSTLASIVEEETANKSEMPMVAELYLSRNATPGRSDHQIQSARIRTATHSAQTPGGRKSLQYLQARGASSRSYPHCFHSGNRKRIESCTA